MQPSLMAAIANAALGPGLPIHQIISHPKPIFLTFFELFCFVVVVVVVFVVVVVVDVVVVVVDVVVVVVVVSCCYCCCCCWYIPFNICF